ncbi:polymorphic outer membrane protein middle domain-containing protein [Chlamydia vaughanii]|uniref:polymorphic outer membrane protein middle domain-containing protein n=1 Tax=Chlamydia vaughanii TaxID=3112552 RepID=UPI0032B1A418
MHSYVYSLLWLISLGIFSYQFTGIAKEKKNYSLQDVINSQDIYLWSIPLKSNRIHIDPVPRKGLLYSSKADLEITNRDFFFSNRNYHKGNGGSLEIKNLNFSNNGPTIFLENNSSNSGGGIFCQEICKISDNLNGIIFKGNYAADGGGAVCAQSLNIQSNGSILFLNNRTKGLGGAIYQKTTGEVYLSADYGDIIFYGNFHKTAEGRPSIRNSIAFANRGTLKIGARKGRHVVLHDPIEHEQQSTEGTTFNPENYHLGTILFSSEYIPLYFTDDRSYCSYFRSNVNIAHGTVAVAEKAGLALFNLTQNSGYLCLGNSTVIKTTASPKVNNNTLGTTTNCQLTITKLALNLPALCQENAKAPKIWIYPTATTTGTGATAKTTYTEDDKPTITVSGPLTLLDSNSQDPYDSVDLSKEKTRVPFLYLCENTAKKINIDDLDIDAINNVSHYGYQGIWTTHWETNTTVTDNKSDLTANTNHRYLYADWAPIGYIPNPKYGSSLVANALWETFYTTMAGIYSSATTERTAAHIDFEGQGISITQRDRKGKKGFRMESGGYAVGTSLATQENQKLSFSFAQQLSRVKEKITNNTISSKNYFSAVKIGLPWLNDSVTTTGSLAYSYGDHKVKHFYPEDNNNSVGSFYSYSIAAAIHCSLHPQKIYSPYTLSPFLEAIAFRSSLSSFKERGAFARGFAMDRPLYLITTPMGMIMQWHHDIPYPTTWKLQMAYQPIIYKQMPKILTTLLASKGTWLSSATPVTRSAFAINANNETQLFPHLKIFVNYQGEISSSTFSNYLTTGSSLTF